MSKNAVSGALAIPDVQIERELGRGAQSVVYLGTKSGRKIALKIARDLLGGTKAAEQFRREATILGRIRDEALPEVLEVGELDGSPYMILEYVDGESLDQRIARGSLSESEVREIGATLARALVRVHRLGLIHRDIKPQNIILSQSGRAKLLDFGLAENVLRTGTGEATVGTVLYSSPEQCGALNRGVDGRSDLYSLGLVLYECAVGKLPFLSRDVSEVIRAHASQVPPPAATINPKISRELSDVISKCLAKDPDDRHSSAMELVRALNPDKVATGSAELTAAYPLVGRSEEKMKLSRCVAAARDGNGGMALVQGEPGRGKSRLIQEVLFEAERDGALVLSAKCQLGQRLPFAPLRESLDRLGEAKPDTREKLGAIARGFAAELQVLTPRLMRSLNLEGHSSFQQDPELFFPAVANFLVELSDSFPNLILFFDDIQWIDDATRKVLVRLAPQLAKKKLLVLTASRDDQASEETLNAFSSEFESVLRERLRLDPLDAPAIQALAEAFLCTKNLNQELGQVLFRRGEGSPLATIEYLAAMLNAGLLTPAWGRWVADLHGLEKLGLPKDVIQLIVQRAASLEPSTRDVLSKAAIIGSRFTASLLREILSADSSQIQIALNDAVASNLLEVADAGELSFVHDRVREAILSELTEETARALHQKVAEVLERREKTPELAYSKAMHYRSGNPEKTTNAAVSAQIEAGKLAMANAAIRDAYGFFQSAVELSSRFGIALESVFYELFAETCLYTDRQTEAIENCKRSLDLTKDPLDQARLHSKLARLHTIAFDFKAGRVWLEEGFRIVDVPLPSKSVGRWLAALGGWAISPFLRPAQGVAQTRASVVCALLDQMAFLDFFEFRFDLSIQGSLRQLPYAKKIGLSREVVGTLCTYAGIVASLGMRKKSLKCLQQARGIAEQLGNSYLIGHSIAFTAISQSFRGDEAAMEETCIKGVSDSRQFLTVESLNHMHIVLAWHYLTRGQLIEGERWVSHIGNTVDLSNFSTAGQLLKMQRVFNYGMAVLEGNDAKALQCLRALDFGLTMPAYFDCMVLGFECYFLLERGDLGPQAEEKLRRVAAYGANPMIAPLYMRHFYCVQSAIRNAQLEQAKEPGSRALALKNAKDALKQLKQAATIPLLKAHYLVRKAELHWLCGELSAAARSADQAETIARDLILPLVEADVGTVRAKILRTKGQAKAAEHEAFRAYQSASRSGLNAHARRILKEFHLESESRQRTQGAGYSTAASPHSMTGMVDPNARRKLDALLALSLASVGARSPEDQARIALDQIVKVLGAERALLLLENPLSKELRVTAGRDEQGNDLSEAGAYSRTMIESVRASQQARVMSADEQGEVSVSKSMIAHQLRSLMAAPLMVQDRLIGVVYLDSRVAKGIFGPDDVEILQAMSNHIAIAIETARATEVELERRELAKDLELTGAVQKLLMPKSNSARTATVAMEAFFQPASQSGGDWWWCDPQRDGRITAIFGDVTGHGAASAMVTAAVTSGYRLLSAAGGNDLGNLISELNVHLRRLCSGEFLMTLSAVELDPAEGVIRWWAAGAPPIMIDRKSGKAELLMAQSTPLGAQDFQFKMEEVPISKGDRVFVFTDGAYEITLASGRQLGFKKLMSIFSETHGRGLEDSRQYLVSELKKNQFKAQQEDDITFALFDIL